MTQSTQEHVCRATCFVLAGGAGERLRPLTLSAPKPLLPFGAVHRLLDFTLSNIANSDLAGAYVLSQYMQDDIGRHLGTYWGRDQWDGRGFVNQPPTSGKRYRGTAAAVAENIACVPPDSDLVLVVSADHVYRMDYGELLGRHVRSGAGVTVAATWVPLERAHDFGVISADRSGLILGFEEKPDRPQPMEGSEQHALANMGIYVFDRRLLERVFAELCAVRPALDFGRDVLPYLAARKLAGVYNTTDRDDARYWRDVGTLDAYHECHMDLLDGRLGFDPLDAGWPLPASEDRMVQASNARCRKTGRSVLARSARLGGASQVELSVVGSGAVIEDGAQISRSILLPGARVGRYAIVRNAIIDAGAQIGADARVGLDRVADLEQFGVTGSGVVIVPALRGERAWVARKSAVPTRRARAVAG